jgi:hypothetical protein
MLAGRVVRRRFHCPTFPVSRQNTQKRTFVQFFAALRTPGFVLKARNWRVGRQKSEEKKRSQMAAPENLARLRG